MGGYKHTQDYQRFCPGEEQMRISDAVCLGRRRANFHKCSGCQFNDDERGTRPFEATVIGQRRQTVVKLETNEDVMIGKVFKAYDVRATYPDPLNEDVAWRVGNATAQFLRTTLSGYDRSDGEMNTLIVGRDMRKSSPSLQKAFIEGATATGARVIDIGMIDTSQIYFATNHVKCCGGATTTASHNPANYNGFKICGPKGKPIGADSGLKEIERIAKAIARHAVTVAEKVRTVDLSAAYREYIRKYLIDPKPMTIVVDASNGMAGRWFPILFSGTPNLRIIQLNFEHDGDFKHPPNPLVPANLAQLREAMEEHGADLGACFDGDADRCIFVDEARRIVPCDLLTALLAGEYLKDYPGSTVVYDLRSSRIVRDTVLKHGGTPRRQRVGHVFMKKAMAETNGVFGGELSGHFYFRDFWYCDSGMLAFVAVLNAITRGGQPLGALLRPFERYAGSGEQNFENEDKDGTLEKLAERYRDADEIDRLDGITVQYADWWFNVRASNTEPLLRLNMEAENELLLRTRLAELMPLLGKPAEGH
ncbi:MAG: phosphomannomutase/phosphoglucomutase [Planctomycetes bacterium]|nr:phosphomannomutase/phosphoglucomutase [Planctomycetota bacterium]